MDHRMPLSAAATTTRPFPPQRAVSGSALYFPKPLGRPSHLSSVRSVSQSDAGVVDLTAEGARRNHGGVFGERRELVVVSSPEVIELEDEEEQRPAKRVKLAVEDDEEAKSEEGRGDDMAHAIVAGEKLPSLPKQHTNNSRSMLARRRRHAGESSARKANGLEPPTMATRIPPPKNAADFSPWTGHHAEDILNETVVKVGYSDKPPASIQTECNSAKPQIWNNLSTKNSAGLQMLGYLFTQVIEKRQTLGKCNAPSTFKPPPRVTVTDTKREGWLRDLANPDIPLRKQSRTIPHGVRGKLLMDQCLSKDIPLQRAVWLAKCVGANELRAFRRKGVSGPAAATGESKWIREWTVSVEQFLEGVIATCGEEDWQMRMGYAVKLVTAFYTEQLLDKDHYLDWIVASFGEAELERLPIWIVVLQIYWKDIVCFLRRGRKLALSLLERLAQLSEQLNSANEVLRNRLQKLVAILAVTSRGSLVIPDAWDKYKVLLAPNEMAKTHETLRAVAVSIANRNARLTAPTSKTPLNTRSFTLRLYDMLDTVGLEINHTTLAASCIELVPDISNLVNALFDWTASPYRQGLARVYLTAGIIKALRSTGHDTDSAVMAYIRQIDGLGPWQYDNIYRAIGRLLQIDAFYIGPYLQWLASSGAMYDAAMTRVAKNILGAIPADALSGHAATLRRTLLSRMNHANDVESVAASKIAALNSALANGDSEVLDLFTSNTSIATKTAVADHAERYMVEHVHSETVQIAQLQLLRSVFEGAGRSTAVSDMLLVLVESSEVVILAELANSVAYHSNTLAAIGSFQALVEMLIKRYRTLRTEQPLDRTFIMAMTRLTSLCDTQQLNAELLQNDLLICEQQNTAAVCSPASDNMIGMQASSLETDEDIDAVFASGNSMDDQLLQRVFMRVLLRAGKIGHDPSGTTSKLCDWLNQLRIVGNSSFDELVTAYVKSVMGSSQSTVKPMDAVVLLVASECLGLADVVRSVGVNSEMSSIRLALKLLLEPASAAQGLSPAEQYRYNTIQRLCCSQQAQYVAPLIMAACGDPKFDGRNEVLHDLIIQYTTTHVEVVRTSFHEAHRDKRPSRKAVELSQALVARGMVSPDETTLDIHQVVAMTNPLSIRFCAGALTYLSKGWASETGSADDMAKDVMIEAIRSGNNAWPQLLGTAINDTTKQALHAWAQHQLLFATGDTALEDETQRYLDVLDLTYPSARERDDTDILMLLNDKLREVERQLSPSKDESKNRLDRGQDTWTALSVLLHIGCLHVGSGVTDSDTNKQARANLMMTLCSLCVHPQLLMDCSKAEYVFDLASALSDSLPEQALKSIARSIKPTEARIQALIGTSPTVTSDVWLALASQIPSAQSRGTAQQRALAKHAASQSAASPSTSTRPGVVAGSSFGPSQQPQPPQTQRPWPQMGPARGPVETKMTPFALRRWEIMPDSTPVMSENDASLSLGLFGARKV